MRRNRQTTCCPPKPKLGSRRLISPAQAIALESTFKMLANDTRLRILHALVRAGELCVSEIAAAIRMKPQAVSNQLQRLADRAIVETRRDGLQIYYRVVDPCVVSLLDHGWCLTEDAATRAKGTTGQQRAAS